MKEGAKVIITAALTGAVTTRKHTPHVPLTPAEVAEDARRCANAGATCSPLISSRPPLIA